MILDLGIALAAGAIAPHVKVNPGAVSLIAGTAIAVALVPPGCIMGIMLAADELDQDQEAGLLFSANLLGILIGEIIVLATHEPISERNYEHKNAHDCHYSLHSSWHLPWVKSFTDASNDTSTQ